MARKFKAVISNPDRTVTVYYIGKKLMTGNAFRVNKKSDEMYIIDPNHTVITVTKRLGVPMRYTTCYYKRNIPVPAPMDEIDGGVIPVEKKYQEQPNGKDKEVLVIGKPIDMQFNEWNYSGISSKELATLFNPQFYIMIARANKNKREDTMYYMLIGCLLALAFIGYYIMNSLPGKVAKHVLDAVGS